MTRRVRFFALFLFGLLLLFLAGCGEDGRYGATFINQGEHVIESGEVMTSDVAVAGGTVVFEQGSLLRGSIYLMGGDLTIDGTIDGDVSALGGMITLSDNASISGDFYVAGSEVSRAGAAVIGGEENALDPEGMGLGQGQSITGFLWRLVSTTLLMAGLAALTVRLMPTLTRRLSATSTGYPLVSGALGLLLLLVLPILLVFMAFTIVLIPITIVGLLLLLLIMGYGVIGLGRGIGERLARWRNWRTTPSQAAATGTISITILLNLLSLVPIAGEVSLALVGAVALGSVVLSGFGTRVYEPPDDLKDLVSSETATP